jgi:hypothetical protein
MSSNSEYRVASTELGGLLATRSDAEHLRGCLGIFLLLLISTLSPAQTNCEEGNGLLDFAQPKTMTVQEVIQKFTSGIGG